MAGLAESFAQGGNTTTHFYAGTIDKPVKKKKKKCKKRKK